MFTIYTQDRCNFCIKTKILLDSKGEPYEEINIDSQGISRNRLMELTGRLAIPTIVVNEKVIGGYTDLMKLYG